jgi:hypothetical protein
LHIIAAFRPNEVRRSDYSQAAKWPILSSGFASQEQVVRGSRERETTATVRGLPRPDVNGKVQNAAAAVARANAQL